MKLIEPLERFVQLIIVLWLVELVFKPLSRRSEQSEKAKEASC
jgi:hypothetical protein